MNFGGDHPAHGHGKISPRCVPKLPAMARYRPGAFPRCRPWRDCALMRSRRGLGRGNTGSWQHIAAMCSDTACFGKICVLCVRKAPQSAVGECTARTSCRQGAFSPSEALRSCTAHESCRPPVALPLRRGSCPSSCIAGSPFNGLALAQGGVPTPAPRRYLPLAVPVAARDKPPTSFGGGHPAHGLQFGQAPRDRRLHHLDGQADIGMLRRTGPGFQNREQVGTEPQAEAAGRAGPAPALPETPIERTNPSWRNYRNTPKIATKVAFLGCPWPSLRQPQFHQPSRSYARSSRSINATQDFSGCHLTSSRQSFSRLCRSVSQHRCRVGLSWAALAQFAPGPFEIYWSCLGS